MMGQKSILISINTSWNIFNFRRNLLRFLQSQGFKIIVLAPKDDYSKLLIDMGFDYVELKMNRKGSNPFQDLQLLRQYKKVISELRPDICLFYTIKPNIYGSLACTSLNIPFINNISGLGTVFLRNNISSKIAKKLYQKALKKSNCVFFQNSDDRKIFRESKLIEDTAGKLIPGSGVDIEHFDFREKKEKGVPFRVLMLSRLIFDKGIREFINAVIALKDEKKYEFVLVGKSEPDANLGLSKGEMKDLVSKTGIHWLKHLDDVRPELEKADSVVLPSYREGLSKALLEACAIGRPIIASNVPGCRELIENEVNGLLCEVKNADDLAKKINAIAEYSDEKLKEMGKKSRLMIEEQYSEERIFDAYLNEIKQILK